MEDLLARLKAADYEMHALSNYPSWYLNIEKKLVLSKYLDWTFVSCMGPMEVRAQHRCDNCITMTIEFQVA